MINRIAFTGRETMLTAGLKTGLKKAEVKMPEIVKASSILPGKQAPVTTAVYTSPFAPINNNAVKINPKAEASSPINGLDFFG